MCSSDLQGYPLEDAEKMVEIKSKDEERWVNAMMLEELGLMENTSNPFTEAGYTMVAFIVAGAVPLLAYLADFIFNLQIPATQSFFISMALSGLALFGLGAAKVKITERNPFRSGLEMLIVGGAAAGVAYLIGALLKGLGVG